MNDEETRMDDGQTEMETGLEVAVIGMAGRFPRAPDIATFWQNLRGGVESVSFFSDEELLETRIDPALLADPDYVKAGAFLEAADLFDAGFFGFSPREAEILDPQFRLFLECAWDALEDAGYVPEHYGGLIGVYGAAATSGYALRLLSDPELARSVAADVSFLLASSVDTLCTRVSYKLDLEGPSMTIQTACSSSLVAVHVACQALCNGDCDTALAGGVKVRFPQKVGYLYQDKGIGSPDGHCRSFDARARGTVPGQGVGIVVLKRLADALEDGDMIRAVIKGSAVNNDGSRKVGYTAPRVEGQLNVVRAAHQAAEIDPATIRYVEAHGSATPVGDPMEAAGLSRAFREETSGTGFCGLGSVKTNIGHLDTAAGVAGLIKTVLALEHRELPPSLHFESPNPELDLENSPFYVQRELAAWPEGTAPRRAGVNSLGIGGTNAHVVLEEAPAPESAPESARPWHLVLLSARTPAALGQATTNLGKRLESCPELDLADVAYTTQVGRRAFEHRRVVVARDRADAADVLGGREEDRLLTSPVRLGQPSIAFLFPGLGDHYAGMGAELYRTEPGFRADVDRCAEILEPHLELDLRALLHPAGAPRRASARASAGPDLRKMLARGEEDEANRRLGETRFVQPALFVVEYATARLWTSWGIEPRAMLGYSLGEWVAACLAGVLSLEDALALVAQRARLISTLPAGAMLAVPLSEEQVGPYLGGELSLAALNGPAMSVAAGPPEAVGELEERLLRDGCPCRRLRTSHAFHSGMMEAIAEPFLELVRRVELRPPEIPYLSNVSGTWIRAEEATRPEYWVGHLCRTVRFADALAQLWREPERVFLEVGPGQTLGSLALQHPGSAEAAERVVLASLPAEHDDRSDTAFLLRNLGQLWLAGGEIDWQGFHAGERRRRVALPTYPFERRRFLVEDTGPNLAAARSENAKPDAGTADARITDAADWFHVPSWKRSVPPPAAGRPPGLWLVFVDELGVGRRLARRMRSAGHEVIEVAAGTDRARDRGDRRRVLDPRRDEDYVALVEDLGRTPAGVVHLWNVTADGGDPDPAAVAEARDRGFFSLVSLVRALDQAAPDAALDILVVANGLCAVERGDEIHPEKALLRGPVRVINQEFSALTCRLIDIDPEELDGGLPDRLEAELGASADPRAAAVVWRGPHRWIETFEPARLEAVESPTRLREGGVYLVTGGLGGLGLALAEHLARTVSPRLVLLGRSELPPRSEWPRHLGEDGDPARRIRGVRALEDAGAEVLVLAADVTDAAAMGRVASRIRERFGGLDGVFHTAGVPGGGLLRFKTRDEAVAQQAPKVEGTLVLADAVSGLAPDLFVLYSSIAAMGGGLGQAAYSSANAFLDAWAQSRDGRDGCAVVSINWCEWQWDSWTGSTLAANPAIAARIRRQREIYGLRFEEGMDALGRILSSAQPQVLVSTRDLTAYLEQHSLSEALEVLESTHGREGRRHARPVLGTPYAAPRDSLERGLAEIWEELFGIEQIGIHDNFYELGGHSLLGMQMVPRIRSSLGVELPLDRVLEKATVAELALAVIERRAGFEEAAVSDLLAELEGMSEEEAHEVLAAQSAGETGVLEESVSDE